MSHPLQPGQTYGDFEIHGLLRENAEASVYEVSAPGFGSHLALKVSSEPVKGDEPARRALREVAVLESLTNAHVMSVYGSGLGPDDRWFILLDHAPGAQLDRWHDFDRPLPAADAVKFIHQACLGLAEVHAAGIVHRDLRPGALWIMPDGTVKLLDFASARSWGSDATGDNVTVGFRVTGSPQYAAPEQAFESQLTPAADVYSLGVLLYEMLTGHSPFYPELTLREAIENNADDPGQWMRAHANKKPAPLRAHPAASNLPTRLCAVVERTLAKSAAERHANAAELANELGSILHELGATRAAILRARSAGGRPQYSLVLPGSHRLGRGAGADLQLHGDGEDGVVAILEWAGAPKQPQLVAAGAPLKVNGNEVAERRELSLGDKIEAGSFELELTYPRG
jgi:serine/threonine-protein kinase